MINETDEFLAGVVGQNDVKSRLWRLTEAGKLPHALLFYGNEGTGKEAAGLELGRHLLCSGEKPPCGVCNSCKMYRHFQHPDFYYLFPIKRPVKVKDGHDWVDKMSETELENYRKELKNIENDLYYPVNYPGASGIILDQVRLMIQRSSLTSYMGGRRYALISPAEAMNLESQNSLLKLLEEPPPDFFLCLVSSRPEAMLPTVVSRCQAFYFRPLSEEEIAGGLIRHYQADAEKVKVIAKRADGSFGQARLLFKEGDPARDEALDVFLQEIVKENPVAVYNFCRKYEKTTNKAYLKQILLRLDQWFKDVSMLDAGLNPQYNGDKDDRLERFRRNMKYNNLEAVRQATMEAVDLVDKNVYIDMILTNLAAVYRKHIKWIR